MKYIKQFSSHTDYEEWVDEFGLTYPNVSQCVEEDDVHYNPIPYKNSYLTFIALEDTQYKFTNNSLQYSVDDGSTWTTLAANTNTPTIHAGERVMWKQTGLTPTSASGIGIFVSTGEYKAQGNVMSLYYGDDFIGEEDLTGKDYAFRRLFQNSGYKLVDVSHLSLPATTLSSNCYRNMFVSCSAITIPPELPATNLADSCYSIMFQRCDSLVRMPKLPATVLAPSCYSFMFNLCSNLREVYELPSTILKPSCYGGMFKGCSSLEKAQTILPAKALVSGLTLDDYGCYESMFQDCTSLTTAPELPATNLSEATYCYRSMFSGCTSLTTIPNNILPATTLGNGCYMKMFIGCTSLEYAPALPATALTSNCYYEMFYGCSSLQSITALFLTEPSSSYLGSWVSGVANSGTFYFNCNAQWDPDNFIGTNGIPSGWDIDCDTVDNYIGDDSGGEVIK